MGEGMRALAKVRTYTYIVFFMYLAMLFHDSISGAIGIGDRKLVFGLVALAVIQVILCVLYDVKYATTVPRGKMHKVVMMYCARLRLWLLVQIVLMILQVANEAYLGNYYLDKVVSATLIVLTMLTLKTLTILQRGNYQVPDGCAGGGQGKKSSGGSQPKKKKKKR